MGCRQRGKRANTERKRKYVVGIPQLIRIQIEFELKNSQMSQ